MLEFDPTKRISVDQALGHSFLADFHTHGMEMSSDSPLDSAIEVLRESPDNLKATVSLKYFVLCSIVLYCIVFYALKLFIICNIYLDLNFVLI